VRTILAKPGHEGCGVYPAATLEEVLEFFHGRSRLPNALQERIEFKPIIEKALDFGRIRGQQKAKRAALIAAAGGHNLLRVYLLQPFNFLYQIHLQTLP